IHSILNDVYSSAIWMALNRNRFEGSVRGLSVHRGVLQDWKQSTASIAVSYMNLRKYDTMKKNINKDNCFIKKHGRKINSCYKQLYLIWMIRYFGMRKVSMRLLKLHVKRQKKSMISMRMH